MRNKNLIYRFNVFQKERFPFAILVFTTLAVVLSSLIINIPAKDTISKHWVEVLIGTITCLLFMFHIRVLDEYKDLEFDGQYHPERPVQRGIIKLKELRFLDIVGLIIQAFLNLFFSLTSFLYWLIALIYTLIAGKEFFIKNWIRKHFYLYNILNLLQLFLLQIYLYALIDKNFSLKNSLLTIHFIFALLNALLLEFARKMYSKDDESKGKDTYSSRLGVKLASLSYSGIYIIIYGLFLYILFKLTHEFTIFYYSLIPLSLIILSTMLYLTMNNKLSTTIVKGAAILFYLSTHLLLVFTRI